jgi:ribosomal protein L11 methyltransferase
VRETGGEYYVGADFQIPPIAFDLFAGALWEAGTIGFQYSETQVKGKVCVQAFFPRGTDPGTVIERLIPWLRLNEDLNLSDASWNRLEREDWSALWRSTYAPIEVSDRIVIAPSWSRKRYPGRLLVKIKPRMAFGTGSHETTRLSLEALIRRVKPGDLVADIGTGSGILTITALRLGAATVDACDVDSEAVKNARYNVRLNGLKDQVHVVRGDIECLRDEPTFDVIVANLVYEPLRQGLQAMAARLAPDGVVLISGLLAGQDELLADVISGAGLKVARRAELNGWVLLELQANGAPA